MNPIPRGHLTSVSPIRANSRTFVLKAGTDSLFPQDGIYEVLGLELLWAFCCHSKSQPKDNLNVQSEAKWKELQKNRPGA